MPTSAEPGPILIFGCGYLGRRVAQIQIERGRPVFGTTRSPARAAELRSLGIEPVVLDVTDRGSLASLPPAMAILYCVGFDRRAGRSIREVYVDGFRNVLDALAEHQSDIPIVYASSTGVYGGDDGAWVDETTPVDPQTESGRACWDAEQLLVARTGVQFSRSMTLRFAGLYGPGRIMREESLRRGEPVVGNADKYLNFIQIDDAAAVTAWALDQAEPAGHNLYLVSDGHPVTRTEFYGTTAEYLGAPPPRFEAPEPGSAEAKREGSNKRISNRKLLGDWGQTCSLRYPDIRAGLAASLGVVPQSLEPSD